MTNSVNSQHLQLTTSVCQQSWQAGTITVTAAMQYLPFLLWWSCQYTVHQPMNEAELAFRWLIKYQDGIETLAVILKNINQKYGWSYNNFWSLIFQLLWEYTYTHKTHMADTHSSWFQRMVFFVHRNTADIICRYYYYYDKRWYYLCSTSP